MSERMQSLLSRAVEDQLSEQRQLAGVLGEIRAVLGRLDEQLGALRAAGPDGAAAQVEQASAAVSADVRDAVRVLAERLDGVSRLVQQRGHDLAEIRGSVAELKESVDRQVAAIDGVSGGLGALPAFGERIEALQGGLGGLHDRLNGLEELVAGVAALQQRGETTETALRELRHAFSGAAARLAELPARGDVESMLARPVDGLDAVGARLGRVETALPSLLERLDAIDAATTGVEARLRELAEQLTDGTPAAGTDPVEREEATVALADLRAEIERRFDELAERDTGDTTADRLSVRIDELHERLFGEGGLQEQVTGLAVADGGAAAAGGEPVEELVTRAVADSERRLAAHVDEAVLALAEALLKRRASRAGVRAEIVAAAAPAPAAPVVSEPSGPVVADEFDEPTEADEPTEPDEPVLDEGAEEPDAASEEPDEPSAGEADAAGESPAAPWQTPTGRGQDAETERSPDQPRKRKPWWRPGD
jgi:chromosome segregation ATPase